MKKEDINTRLNKVLSQFGNPAAFNDKVSSFRYKLEVLFDTNKYSRLLKSLFSSRERSEFNSYIFEALFAFDFVSNGHELIYEAKCTSKSDSSIDFCYSYNEKKIFFELRLIRQRHWITKWFDAMLKKSGSYEITLDAQDSVGEEVRIQNLILSKCQDKKGKPIKFTEETGAYNFIAINVSELHLTTVDRADCMLVMYGDRSVPFPFRLGIFGLCQELSRDTPELEEKYYQKFKHFRETIHGVLFVKFARENGQIEDLFIDRKLEYFLIGNNNIIENEEFGSIECRLKTFLKEWS